MINTVIAHWRQGGMPTQMQMFAAQQYQKWVRPIIRTRQPTPLEQYWDGVQVRLHEAMMDLPPTTTAEQLTNMMESVMFGLNAEGRNWASPELPGVLAQINKAKKPVVLDQSMRTISGPSAIPLPARKGVLLAVLDMLGQDRRDDIIKAMLRTNELNDEFQMLDDMEISESDVNEVVNRNAIHQLPPTLPQDHTDMDTAWANLTQATVRAGIVSVRLPSIAADDPVACNRLARALNDVSQAFFQVSGGVATPGQGVCHLDVGLVSDSSGVMNSGKEPVIGLNTFTGWDIREVTIHEFLHAHDNLLAPTHDGLISDIPQKKKQSAVLTAWGRLAQQLDAATEHNTASPAQRQQQIKNSFASRWTFMGIPEPTILAAQQRWDADGNDQIFLSTMRSAFKETPFADTADFRSLVMLAECKLAASTLDERPVHVQMVDRFDAILSSIGIEEDGVYSAGYFEDRAEKMARSFQLLLNDTTTHQSTENPYEGRWLVYADHTQAPAVRAAWEEFFQTPEVRAAYTKIGPEATPSVPEPASFRSAISKFRSAKAPSATAPTMKKAAL